MAQVAADAAALKEREAEAPSSEEVYLGMVKSYNSRRGFGFVACSETAAKYRRDVYVAKAEVQPEAEGADAPTADKPLADTRAAAGGSADKSGTAAEEEEEEEPALVEGDPVHFRVRLSLEGFPQTTHLQKLPKYTGTIVRAPAPGAGGLLVSEDLEQATGTNHAEFKAEVCGHVRLAVGDEVTFTVQEGGSSKPGKRVEAKLVVLAKPHQTSGAILSCCGFRIPRKTTRDSRHHMKPDLRLDLHALSDRLILAGLPQDVGEAELLRFFAKQGATNALVARAHGNSFASVSFPSTAEIARFLSRSVHAFADDGETRIASLSLTNCSSGDRPRLPALPAPILAPGAEAGVLQAAWSPVVLATGYLVELRAAEGQAQWCAVDVHGGLGDSARRFEVDCSTCRVAGLPANQLFTARVTYYTACGCRAVASDPSEWCYPIPGSLGLPPQLDVTGAVCRPCLPQAQPAVFPQRQAQQAPALSSWPAWLPQKPPAFPSAADVQQQAMMGRMPLGAPAQPLAMMAGDRVAPVMPPAYASSPSWRCAHGAVIPQPLMPELIPGDEQGFAVLVQWPSAAHASAYIIELRGVGSARTERFVRSAPAVAAGALVELRVGGLVPGSTYEAQVRCVGACGCESAPSPIGYSAPLGMAANAAQAALDQAGKLHLAAALGMGGPPHTAPGAENMMFAGYNAAAMAPQVMQPSHAQPQQQQPQGLPLAQANKQWQYAYSGAMAPPPSHEAFQTDGLPNLLQSSRMPPVPPPAGPPGVGMAAAGLKEPVSLEVAGKEELPSIVPNMDSIILD